MNWHSNHQQQRSTLDRIADKTSGFFGAWTCVLLHTCWFGLWFYFKLDVSLLTNVVSLEAIYLTMLVLMSSNRAGERDRHQAEADYEINRQSKEEVEELIERLDRIENQKLDKILKVVNKVFASKNK